MCRAIERSLKYGAHGLPLMGSGDWNDGMNRVGAEGRGESVWLGWFLVAVLNDIGSRLRRPRSVSDLAQRYRSQARWLTGMLELAWDGDWYRRAYFDDGTPLGSVQNEECKLDSLTQSWAVLSEAADRARAERAMDAVRAHLVRRDAQLVLLLTPPFDRMTHDPGYIKGYLPGVRENGGQYTHAALWTVIALARLGRGDEAMELFHMLNPINHMPHARGRRALPRRTVRGRGGRLRASDARRSRRLDVVHGFGRMDVSGGRRRPARSASGTAPHSRVQPVHSGDVARLFDGMEVRQQPVSNRGAESGAPVPRRPRRAGSTARRWMRRQSPFATIAKRTPSSS